MSRSMASAPWNPALKFMLTSVKTNSALVSRKTSFSSGPDTRAPYKTWGLASVEWRRSHPQGAGRSGQELEEMINIVVTYKNIRKLKY